MTARRPSAAEPVEVFEVDPDGRPTPGASGDPDGLGGNGSPGPSNQNAQTNRDNHPNQNNSNTNNPIDQPLDQYANDHSLRSVAGNQNTAGNANGPGAPREPIDIAGAGTGPDAIHQGRERTSLLLAKAARWRRSVALQRGLVGATIVVGVAALGVAGVATHAALTAKPGTQYFVDERLVPPEAVTVDVLGCPHAASCAVEAAPTSLVTLARRLSGPGARITSALQTVDGASHRVYRREIDLAADRLLVRVVAQCVPGAGPVSAQPVFTDDSSRSPVRPGQRASALIPGAAGCSLYVEADIVTGSRAALTKLVAALAGRRELVVAP